MFANGLVWEKTINRTLFVVELVVAALLLFGSAEKRRLYGLRLAAALVVTVFLSYALSVAKDAIMDLIDSSTFSVSYFWISYAASLVTYLVLLATFVATVALIYRLKVSDLIFVSCASVSVRCVAGCLYHMYVAYLNFRSDEAVYELSDWVSALVYIAVYAVVYVLLFLFVRRCGLTLEKPMSRGVYAFMLVMAVFEVAFAAVNIPQNLEQALLLYVFVQLAMAFLGLVGLMLQFYLERMLEMRTDKLRQEQMIEKQREQFRIASDSIDKVNLNAHDLKRQISLIMQAAWEDGMSDEVREGLSSIMDSVNAVDTIYSTGNAALDIVLTEKSRLCGAKGICFSAMVDGSGLGVMNDLDVYMLFGNILDNAIEAAEKMEREEDRVIIFRLSRAGGVSLLHVENTTRYEPRFVGGFPRTSKEDKANHGFGTRSAARMAEKYGGTLKMCVRNGVFYLDAGIPEQRSE